MDALPVPDHPAILLTGSRRWLCVSDLHIGIEHQLRGSGFNIPAQTRRMAEVLEELSGSADHLLVLGDVKHRIPHAGHREDREIRPFMSRLLELFEEVVITAGNHDGGLAGVLPDGCRMAPASGERIEDVGAFHGHVWPSEETMGGRRLIMGHLHPAVAMVDSIGTRTTEKCWVRARFAREQVVERYGSCPREVIVVPAFNPLITGTPVNGEGGISLGPLFRNHMVREDSVGVFLMDGSNLGRPRTVPSRPRGRYRTLT